MFKQITIIVSSLVFLVGCKSDIRTTLVKKEGQNTTLETKGKALLKSAWEVQGFNNLKNHNVYSFSGHDEWKGLMASVGKLWPDKVMDINFKYQLGTFDGQLQYTSGKHKGEIKGLQNWNYYEIENKDTTFTKPHSKVQFGLSAFQYFTELVDRLQKAPIILYAGEKDLRGQTYDLVFCTWNSLKPNNDADQYVAWINKKTGLLEFTQYTIRENYLKLPGAKIFYGGVEFSDFKSINGIQIPHTQSIYAFNLKTNEKRFLHRLTISNFAFDNFPLNDLKLNKSLTESGDFKR